MRKVIETDEAEGLDALLGERVTLFCLNYIYTGKLVGINAACVKLSEPAIVFETGAFDDAWKNAEALPHDWYVQTSAIESFGVIH